MNRQTLGVAVMAFALGLSSVLLIYKKGTQVTSQPLPSLSPTPTSVSLQIPNAALQGIITQASGNVQKIPWDAPQTASATEGGRLIQGDEIITHDAASALLTITSLGTLHLQQNSHLLLDSLLPNRILLQQLKGTISYNAAISQMPISVRVLGALVQYDPHVQSEISISDSLIHITIASGSAILGYINNNNLTQAWKLQKGDITLINDTTGRVITTGKLLPTSQ